MKKGFITVLSGMLACSGCANTAVVSHHTPDRDVVDVKLVEAGKSVSRSLSRLAAIESASIPSSQIPTPPNPESLGMTAKASVNWTGPVAPLLEKITKISGYKLRILGIAPALPVIISVVADNASLASILRDAQFQIQKTAEVSVYPEQKIVELRYQGS